VLISLDYLSCHQEARLLLYLRSGT